VTRPSSIQTRRPDFFIVGAPKSGTTAWNAYLRQHPEIYIPKRKELHYFGADLEFTRPRISEDEYMKHFLGAEDEKRVGEASVWYLYSANAASEIKSFSPTAQIIIMLRNPVDMLHSLHGQFLYEGDEDIADFGEAIEAEEDRRQGRCIPKGSWFPEGLLYTQVGSYSEQVARYLRIFGRDRVHVVLFDEIQQDIGAAFRKTLSFLEVDNGFRLDFRLINPYKEVRSGLWRDILHNPPGWLRSLTRTIVPRPIRSRLGRFGKRLNTAYLPRKPLDPSVRRKLHAMLAEDVERLSTFIGGDLSSWRE
jgi:hypothetical protein